MSESNVWGMLAILFIYYNLFKDSDKPFFWLGLLCLGMSILKSYLDSI